MASTSELNIWVRLKDDASKALQGLSGKVESLQPVFQKTALAGGAILGTVGAIALKSIKDYGEAEKSAKQLEHATLNVAHATQEHLKALNATADALQKKGVLDGDAIKMGQAQLMTFGLSADFVNKLSGSMADLAVNQFGVNAGGEQLTQTANIMAKALNGQFGILEKSGIRFTDLQKKMIQYGNETERATALQEGLAQNLKFTNEVALGTFEGKLAKVQTLIGDVSEGIGSALMPAVERILDGLVPIVTKMAEWASNNPALITTILGVATGLGLVLTAVGGIGLLLPSIIAGFTTIGTVLGTVGAFLIGPWGLAITAVVGGFVLLWTQSEAFRETIMRAYDAVKNFLLQAFNEMVSFLRNAGENWENIKNKINEFKDSVMGNVVVIAVISQIKDAFTQFWTVVQTQLWPALQQLWDTVKNQLWPSIQELYHALEPFFPLFEMLAKVIGALILGAFLILIKTLGEIMEWVAKVLTAFTELTTFIVKIASGIIKGVADDIKSVADAFKTVVDWIARAINAFKEFKNSGASLNPLSSSFKLPFVGRDIGGPVREGMSYIVGEKGPEMITMGGSGYVSPMGGGGSTIVITGNTFIGPRDLARTVGDELVDLLKINKRIG